MTSLSPSVIDGAAGIVADAAIATRPAGAWLGRIGVMAVTLIVAFFASTIDPPGGMTSIASALPDAAVTLTGVLCAVFAGALVSGLAGFAFSAVAGALLLRLLTPAETVSLLLVSSLGAQLISTASLRGSIAWREVLPLVAAGLLGIPIGGALLLMLPATMFVTAFGIFLVGYSAFMLVRPGRTIHCRSRIPTLISGFIGGVTGGAIAFPGAVPTIWCCMQGMAKTEQRALTQPFILIMQVATIGYFSGIGLMTSETLLVSLVCAPVVLAGTWLGLCLYRRCSDAEFRQLVLVVLLICGAMLL